MTNVQPEKPSNRPRILVTTDLSEGSFCAFPFAKGYAEKLGAQIELFYNLDRMELSEESVGDGSIAMARARGLDAAKRRLDEIASVHFSGVDILTVIGSGVSGAANIICNHAHLGRHDLIVMAALGGGSTFGFGLGSVSERVMRGSPCKVLVTPCAGVAGLPLHLPVRRIALLTDFSSRAAAAEHPASTLALCWEAEVVLLHVAPTVFSPRMKVFEELISGDESAEIDLRIRELAVRELQSILERMQVPKRSYEVLPKVHSVSKTICEYAFNNEIDLVVLSARGTGKNHLIGGVAEGVVRNCNCPVLVVPCDN